MASGIVFGLLLHPCSCATGFPHRLGSKEAHAPRFPLVAAHYPMRRKPLPPPLVRSNATSVEDFRLVALGDSSAPPVPRHLVVLFMWLPRLLLVLLDDSCDVRLQGLFRVPLLFPPLFPPQLSSRRSSLTMGLRCALFTVSALSALSLPSSSLLRSAKGLVP